LSALRVPSAGAANQPALGWELAGAALLGALFSLPFVHTWAWALGLACIALLAWRVQLQAPGRAAAIGVAFGTAWLVAGTWWLFISLHQYGGLPAVLAVVAVLLLSFGLSLYLGLAMALFARLRRGHVLADAALFAACWLAAELARGVLFTGFPWVATGYAWVDSPLAALAPWIGVYGLGALIAAGAAVLAAPAASLRRRTGAWGTVGLVLAATPWLAHDFTRPSGRLAVTLIQTNVSQDEKFAVERMPQALAWLQQQLHAARGDLVVAPETAIPLLPDQLGAEAWAEIKAPFVSGQRAALIGLPLGDFETGYSNSVAGLSEAAATLPGGFYRYDKHHLVPFGEFIPTGFKWFVALMNIPLGDFNRGPLTAPSFNVRGERVAPNICYEDLFGEELAQRFTDPAQAPTVFANISNIAWFGDSIAIEQHLNITRMRTLELQRPMVRATNTGATAVVDHTGRVTASLPPLTQGVLAHEVEGREGLTPFVRWASRFGLWPLLLFSVAVIGVAAVRRRR
jgi:apolipoprotein N-acyltransferase